MENDNIALVFIIGAIVSLLFIAGLLFLIIYGLSKKKKAFWITGTVIASICILLYICNYYRAYHRAIDAEQEIKENYK